MTPVTSFRWFYPPRTGTRVPYKPDSFVLKMWKGFPDAVAQWKMNGTNDSLWIYPDGKMEHWIRHKYDDNGKECSTGQPQQVKNFTLIKPLHDMILDLVPRGVFTMFNVELMHFKTTMVKNTLYFFDTLIWESQHLTGVPYKDRHGILLATFGQRRMPLDYSSIDGKLFVADNMPPVEWDSAWEKAKPCPYCEGLVLKRLGDASRLVRGDTMVNNAGALLRIRKPTKNARY